MKEPNARDHLADDGSADAASGSLDLGQLRHGLRAWELALAD
jgi:hypothetical protein